MSEHKNCHTCKHEHNSSSSDPCSTCDASYKWNLDDATYNNWEPKDEEPDCEKCKHEDKDPEEEPCQECGIDGDNYFEPKEPQLEQIGAVEEEKYCCDCKHVNTSDLDIPCAICNGYSKFEPKEEKKMDNRKTKAQLMEELEQKNTEIAALKKELERSEDYELFVTVGKEMRDAIDGLVAGGLTEEQAFQVLMACALGRI